MAQENIRPTERAREKEGHPAWRCIGYLIKMETYNAEATERSVLP